MAYKNIYAFILFDFMLLLLCHLLTIYAKANDHKYLYIFV